MSSLCSILLKQPCRSAATIGPHPRIATTATWIKARDISSGIVMAFPVVAALAAAA
jgi:hypothetical protein